MKKLLLFLLLIFTCNMAFGQKALFDKYDDVDGISTVYISPTMMRMMKNVKAGNKDISRIANRLDHIYILECERPSMINSIKATAEAYYRRGKYALVMKTKSKGEVVNIYEKKYRNGKSEFVLLSVESNELVIINLFGKVSLSEIQSITG